MNLIRIKILLILALTVIVQNIFAQNSEATITGFVYDSSNGEALIGANVYIKELNLGSGTNRSGYFAVPNIPAGNYKLTVSYVGYQTYTQGIKILENESKRIDISLNPSAVLSEEIVVSADSVSTIEKLFNKPVSKIDLTPAQIGKIPQFIEADLLRTLQTLPGIVPVSDYSSAIYIRGGTPDQNLFLLDGTDVYNPEHAFGLFSTFNTDAIKKVEIYKGGFGAEYGGRLSSVINITNNDGNRNNFQGKVSVSLLAVNTTLQTPLGDFGSLSGSLRRTYFDKTVGKFIDDIPDYYFLDGNLKAFFDLSESNKLSVSFYGGIDDLAFVLDKKRPESLGFDYVWGNQTGSINWRTIITPKLFGNFWITGSRFFSNFDFDDVGFTEDNLIEDITLKGAIDYFFSDSWNFKFGFEQKNVNGSLKEDFLAGRVDVSKKRKLYSAYITSTWKPSILWDIEAGLRGDYFDSDADYKNLDPRLTIKYKLTQNSNLKFSAGLYHQYANRIPRLFFVSIWTSADEYIKGSSASQFILGYQKALSHGIEFEVEAYYKDYKNIYSYNQTFLADLSAENYTDDNLPLFNSTKGLFNRADGKSYGLEFMLRKDASAISGWISYAYARTEYLVDGINRGKSFVPRHDRTHALNIVANIDLKNWLNEIKGKPLTRSDKNWLLGLNLTYFSGQPITLPSSIYLINQVPDWEINRNSTAIYPSEINEFRLPYYARLDLSLTYEIQYDGWTLAPYIQAFNLLNRKNVWFIEYNNNIVNGKLIQEINTVNMFPILPSVGVNINF